MFYFTNEQIDEIERRLAVRAKKDTDFDSISDVDDADLVAIIHNGRNMICRLDSLPGRLQALPYNEIEYPSEEDLLVAPTAFSLGVLKDIIGISSLPEFDETKTYEIDEYVSHVDSNGIRRCYFFTQNKDAGYWEENKVEEINYSTIAERLQSLLANFKPNGIVTVLASYFTDGKANRAIADEDGNNIKEYYALKSEIPDVSIAIRRLIEGKLDKFSLGAHDLPVWFDENKEPQVIDALTVPNDITSGSNIQAMVGMAAGGIANIGYSEGAGGMGTVTAIDLGPDGQRLNPDNGIITFPLSSVTQIGAVRLSGATENPQDQTIATTPKYVNAIKSGLETAISNLDTNLSHDIDVLEGAVEDLGTQIEGKLDNTPVGSLTRPIFIDTDNTAKQVTGINVPDTIHSGADIEAEQGMAAGGLANLSLSVGGQGDVTGVQFDSTQSYQETQPYTAVNGIVKLPSYPAFTSLTSNGTNAISATIGNVTKNITVATLQTSLGLGGAAYKAADYYLASTLKGAANGLAELDSNGLVPSIQLPSYVDDIIEGYLYNGSFYKDASHTQLITPEDGKIYVNLSDNNTYRWSGSVYTEISKSLALGTTHSTAAYGDEGATAYAHAADSSRLTTAQSSGFYKFSTTAEGHIAGVSNVADTDIVNTLGTTPVNCATGDASGNNIANTYATITNFDALKTGLTSKGAHNLPIYLNANAEAVAIDSLSVTGAIESTQNGVAAGGISGLSMTGGGQGTVTRVDVGTTQYSPVAGVISLPAYPVVPTNISAFTNDSGYITGITSSMVTTALGFTPFDEDDFTQSNIQTTLGISNWALASSKPSYDFSEIGSKPTTLSGYGITDAKIESGVITLGSDTITPLTSHQSVTDNNPTLAWGQQSKVGSVGSTDLHVTMPAKPTYTLDDVTDGSTRKLSDYTKTADFKSLTVKGGTTSVGSYSPTSVLSVSILAGNNISVTPDATNHTITIANTYSLPTAASNVKGGIKVGTGLSISNDVLSVKIQDNLTSSATDEALSAKQGKALNDKILALDVTDSASGYVSKVDQTDGKITVTHDNFVTPVVTFSNGTTNGPTFTVQATGGTSSSATIPSASSSQSGVVTTATQSFAGDKTFTGEVTGNKNIQADYGMAAGGIANLSPSSGGAGTLTEIQIDGTTIPDVNGVVDLPAYPSLTGYATESWVATNFAGKGYETRVQTIEGLIPITATSSNKLADVNFVNSSINTATASFKGNYNVVSDLSLGYDATTSAIATALNGVTMSPAPDKNDYCFVTRPTSTSTPTQIKEVLRYKYDSDNSTWSYEYTINNSGFTAAQWAAVNSGITSALVGDIGTLKGFFNMSTGVANNADKLDGHDSSYFATAADYLTLSGGTMVNTNLVTNLNADLLDGKHSSDFVASLGTSNDYLTWTKTGGSANNIIVPYASLSTDTRVENLSEQMISFRQTAAGGLTYKPTSAVIKRVLGNTVVWNQLAKATPSTETYAGVAISVQSDGGVRYNGTSTANVQRKIVSPTTLIGGHSYYVGGGPRGSSATTYFMQLLYNNSNYNYLNMTDATSTIFVWDATKVNLSVYGYVFNGKTINIVFYPRIIDLTLFFNNNIPTGLTAADFERDYGYLLSNPEYNAGELINNACSGLESVGFNLWDGSYEDSNKYLYSTGLKANSQNYDITPYIEILPNTDYYFNHVVLSNALGPAICWYDSSFNYISGVGDGANIYNQILTSPSNARYLRCSIYKATSNVSCVNLSNTSFNGQYEPYRKNKLLMFPFRAKDSNGNIVTISDAKKAGSVRDERIGNKFIQRVGSVDLGTRSWGTTAETYRYIASIVGYKPQINDNTTFNVIIGSSYNKNTRQGVSWSSTGLPDKSFFKVIDSSVPVNRISIKDSSCSTAVDLATALNGVYANYELATPIEYEIIDEAPYEYPIDVLGTESIPQGEMVAPFVADIQYGAKQTDISYDIDNLGTASILLRDRATTLEGYFSDGKALRAIGDTNGDQIDLTYLKIDAVKSKGTNVKPIYFDSSGVPQVITGLSVPNSVESTMGGMAAGGIANLGMGAVGSGTLTQIQVNGTGITDVGGVVNILAAEGSTNGAFSLAGQSIAIHGLGSLAYKSSLAFSELTGKPTTLNGYGITDAYISSGTITLGSNTITPLLASLKGAANGVAELDANGLVPSSQLPSYVDDVLEYASKSAFPSSGETGKIYVALDTNLTWRWSGSAYVEISPSLALGETSSTAYRGDRGATAYAHATDANRLTTAQSSSFYKFATTAQGHIASVTAVSASDLTTLIGNTTYAPYNADGYLPLTGGTIYNSQSSYPLVIKGSSAASGIIFDDDSNNTLGRIYADTDHDISWYNGTSSYTMYHSGNANLSTVNWNCNNLYANGDVGIGTNNPQYKLDVAGLIGCTGVQGSYLTDNTEDFYVGDYYHAFGSGDGLALYAYGTKPVGIWSASYGQIAEFQSRTALASAESDVLRLASSGNLGCYTGYYMGSTKKAEFGYYTGNTNGVYILNNTSNQELRLTDGGLLHYTGSNYLAENTPHYFRDPTASGWRGGMYWGSYGNESLSFIVKNAASRFQFVGDSDIASWSNNTWQNVTPWFTIKADGVETSGNVTAAGGIAAGGIANLSIN